MHSDCSHIEKSVYPDFKARKTGIRRNQDQIFRKKKEKTLTVRKWGRYSAVSEKELKLSPPPCRELSGIDKKVTKNIYIST